MPISRLPCSADFSWGVLWLFLLLSVGCASPCLFVDGSCLELTIQSTLPSGLLKLTLFSGSVEQPVIISSGDMPDDEYSFPAVLRVLPPPGHSASEVSALSVSATQGAEPAQTGTTPISWPEGAHIAQELRLALALVPSPPPTPAPWQYRMESQDFSAAPLGILTPARLAGDGNDALIAMHPGISQLSTLKSVGNGQWTEIATIHVDNMLSALVAADLTDDGNPEVIAVAAGSGTVQLFPGLPRGGLGTPQVILQRADFILHAPVLTDVNRDGRLDLLIANSGTTTNGVVQLLGQPNAGAPLANAVFFSSGGTKPIALTNADFGAADKPKQLAVIDAKDSRALVLWNALTLIESVPSADAHPVAVTSGDMDSDGQQDLAVVYDRGMRNGLLRVLRSQGSGGFSLLREIEIPPSPRGLWAADLARDGAADLVVVCDTTPTKLYILPGTTTSNSPLFPIDLGFPVGDPVILDLNGDQWRDIVVPLQNPSRLVSLIGQPDAMMHR